MKRLILDKLIEWKNSDSRKPLILRGARQVGKTYILQQLGREYYDNVATFNFDSDRNLASVFQATKDPNTILDKLALAYGVKIEPGKTLIIFDEIQECPEAISSLKYFYESTPEYHIACAGSLLGIRLAKTSFPVGKVNFLDMHPMTFTEYLLADGKENLVEYLSSIDKIVAIDDIFSSQLTDELKEYFIIGGMPEAVLSWTTKRDLSDVNRIHEEILSSYERDFTKHADNNTANKISLIWNNIPSQLARDNKKFVYQAIKEGARARGYEDALNWLRDADLINKVLNVTKPAFPLKAYANLSDFKIYMLDVGLLGHMSELDSVVTINEERLFEEFKGSFTEDYCVSMLAAALSGRTVHYFTFDRYEIDALIQFQNSIIPIEIKSGTKKSHTSLKNYISEYNPEIAVRFSTRNLSFDGKILNIPLYLVERTNDLIEIALRSR